MNAAFEPVRTELGSAQALVQAQLEAYNAHDVEALLRCYHPQAQQFEYPDRLLAQGHEALRERMTNRFRASRPVATLLHRIVLGEVVIDYEQILNQSPDGPVVRELVAMYEVTRPGAQDPPAAVGTIVRARFIFGEERRA
ncbi:hypothetical protein SAMN05216359_101663 [Roseateles sp. YR242]|uniref:nuclear transport factor 2 family protein n=1 Tax=Roseateles sp. YR242 TaxID=1855305 RepID=UPI0008C1C836|nr:nuclear transport factor 2 family protein [Roseateles sp. YR242]SEK39060.1 hypothetical protein SAMN05216359_101663 [Roseateles sp. YR242]